MVTAVTTAMTTLKTDILDSMTAVAPIAITVFAGLMVWKYGKKIFSTVAK